MSDALKVVGSYNDSTPEDQKIFQDWLREVLTFSVVTVEFIKSDGSLREMRATLDPKHLPVVENKDTESKRKPNAEVCSVWDVDAKGWRSFRYDRMVAVRLFEGLAK